MDNVRIGKMLTSKSSEWETPDTIFDSLNKEFGFTLDVRATHDNAKCETYFTIKDDGLSQDWSGVCFMNPPYGRTMGRWVEKAYRESLGGLVVVCYIPSRTDTVYWHDYVMNANEVRLIKGRLHHRNKVIAEYTGKDKTSPAPFPSCIVVFGDTPSVPVFYSVNKQGEKIEPSL